MYLPIAGATSATSALGLGGEDHSTRWTEVQASRMGANHFEGTTDANGIAFDRNTFENGGTMPYDNPRFVANGVQQPRFYNPDNRNETSGARFSGWDIVVPVVSLLSLSFLF